MPCEFVAWFIFWGCSLLSLSLVAGSLWLRCRRLEADQTALCRTIQELRCDQVEYYRQWREERDINRDLYALVDNDIAWEQWARAFARRG